MRNGGVRVAVGGGAIGGKTNFDGIVDAATNHTTPTTVHYTIDNFRIALEAMQKLPVVFVIDVDETVVGTGQETAASDDGLFVEGFAVAMTAEGGCSIFVISLEVVGIEKWQQVGGKSQSVFFLLQI